ncbi:MAG: mechanosensitive ion channel family protein [Oscillospiraceae bacterium]|nr:mechanosensitive ion channel family protein [Oscillospiraceae bacterium]
MKNGKKTGLVRFIVCAVILAVLIAIGFGAKLVDLEEFKNVKFDLDVLLRLLMMIAGVICAEALISFILGLFKPENHRARSVLSIIQSVLKYVAAIVILCWGLSILGVNVSTIVASVGILALILGFSAESLIADMVTGAFMIFENQYNVGDIVEVDGYRGTVTSIGLRTTCITDPGGNVKIVNNSAMKNILNRSDRPSRSISVISVPYGTDFNALESGIPGLMTEIKEAHPDVFKTDPVYLGVEQLADSGVVLKFVAEVDEANIFSGARLLNHDLLLGFKELGVECPFPQVDVHNV